MNLQLLAQRPTEEEIRQLQSQEAQMQVNEQALADIEAVQQQTRILEQEGINKSHDPELSPYSAANGFPVTSVIGEKEVREAYATFEKYKEKKAKLEAKLDTYEKFWQLKHWETLKNRSDKRIEPVSSWLVNTILNKHADAMDNYPEPNVLPRALDDEATAKMLSKIIPAILEQNKFKKTYSACMWDKNKFGAGIYGVFWNNEKAGGLGDIDIKRTDISQLFWKPGIENIQDSPNLFMVTFMDIDELKARYP